MSAITLHRTDAARNMHRYYRLDVQPDLFGEWGRIGRPGQMRSVPYPHPSRKHTPRSPRQRPSQGAAGIPLTESAAHVLSLQISGSILYYRCFVFPYADRICVSEVMVVIAS